MKWLRFLALAALTALVLSACGGTDETAEPTGDATVTETETGAPPTSTEVTITAPVGASNSGFAETSISAPADTPFTIVFTNEDTGVPHNVEIYEGTDATGTVVFAPADHALVTGVDEATYEVPALAAGTYFYNCFSHPATMTGTLTVA